MLVNYSERGPATRIRLVRSLISFSAVLVMPFLAVAQEPVGGAPPTTQEEYDIVQRKAAAEIRRLDTQLVTPEIVADFNRDAKAYRQILSSGTNGRNQKELSILKSGLTYRVLLLSDPTVQADARVFENSVKNLSRDLSRAGALISNADDKKRFRELLFELALPLLKQLLQDNLIARSVTMELLLEMEVVPPRGTVRMQMFDQVDDVLIAVLKDAKQPDAVKVRVANSIKRYLVKSNADQRVENALAQASVDELRRKFISVPYQNSLLMALEEVQSPRQLVAPKKPIVICAAVEVMTDSSRDIRIRCRAARVLGRAGYDSGINIDVLAWKVAELTLETSLRFNQSDNQSDPKWHYCGWYLYTAFHHESRQEASGRMPKGFSNRDPKSTLVNQAYKTAVPVMAHLMFNSKSVSAKDQVAINNWVNKNIPGDLRFDPGCPPIKAVAAPPANKQPPG